MRTAFPLATAIGLASAVSSCVTPQPQAVKPAASEPSSQTRFGTALASDVLKDRLCEAAEAASFVGADEVTVTAKVTASLLVGEDGQIITKAAVLAEGKVGLKSEQQVGSEIEVSAKFTRETAAKACSERKEKATKDDGPVVFQLDKNGTARAFSGRAHLPEELLGSFPIKGRQQQVRFARGTDGLTFELTDRGEMTGTFGSFELKDGVLLMYPAFPDGTSWCADSVRFNTMPGDTQAALVLDHAGERCKKADPRSTGIPSRLLDSARLVQATQCRTGRAKPLTGDNELYDIARARLEGIATTKTENGKVAFSFAGTIREDGGDNTAFSVSAHCVIFEATSMNIVKHPIDNTIPVNDAFLNSSTWTRVVPVNDQLVSSFEWQGDSGSKDDTETGAWVSFNLKPFVVGLRK